MNSASSAPGVPWQHMRVAACEAGDGGSQEQVTAVEEIASTVESARPVVVAAAQSTRLEEAVAAVAGVDVVVAPVEVPAQVEVAAVTVAPAADALAAAVNKPRTWQAGPDHHWRFPGGGFSARQTQQDVLRRPEERHNHMDYSIRHLVSAGGVALLALTVGM